MAASGKDQRPWPFRSILSCHFVRLHKPWISGDRDKHLIRRDRQSEDRELQNGLTVAAHRDIAGFGFSSAIGRACGVERCVA